MAYVNASVRVSDLSDIIQLSGEESSSQENWNKINGDADIMPRYGESFHGLLQSDEFIQRNRDKERMQDRIRIENMSTMMKMEADRMEQDYAKYFDQAQDISELDQVVQIDANSLTFQDGSVNDNKTEVSQNKVKSNNRYQQ